METHVGPRRTQRKTIPDERERERVGPRRTQRKPILDETAPLHTSPATVCIYLCQQETATDRYLTTHSHRSACRRTQTRTQQHIVTQSHTLSRSTTSITLGITRRRSLYDKYAYKHAYGYIPTPGMTRRRLSRRRSSKSSRTPPATLLANKNTSCIQIRNGRHRDTA